MAGWKDWVGRAVRPIFRNKEFGPANGDRRKQFDVASPFLTLLNPVIRHGTLHVAGNMNNMFSFDNLIAMGGTRYRTEGLGTGEVTEYIEESVPDDEGAHRLIARRVSVLDDGWRITEELHDLDVHGENVLVQSREVKYTQNGSEWEAAVR